MTKNPILNALSALGYILLVTWILNYVSQSQGDKPDTFFAPVAFLSLLTLSVTIMAYIFFYQPMKLFIEGNKNGALNIFFRTAGIFGGLTIFIWILLLSGLV